MKNKFLIFTLTLSILLMSSCTNGNNTALELNGTTTQIETTISATIKEKETPAATKIQEEETTTAAFYTNTETKAITTVTSVTEVETITATAAVAITSVTTKVNTKEKITEDTTVTTAVTTESDFATETETEVQTEISETEEPEYISLDENNDGTNQNLSPVFEKFKGLTTRYYRGTLSEKEQDIYDTILKFYSDPNKYYTIDNPYDVKNESNESMDYYRDKLLRIVKFVWLDNDFISQDLSNTMGFGYSAEMDKFVFIKNDKMDKEDAKVIANDYKGYVSRLEQAYAKAVEIADSVPPELITQKDIALYFHDYLINNAVADTSLTANLYLNDEAYGPLIAGKGTCEGFTNAFSLLCHLKGIKSFGVMYSGKEKENGHIWNVILLDGVYTQVDVFHDNIVYTDGGEDIRHDFFGMSDQEITDKLNREKKNGIDPTIMSALPQCIDIPV